MIPDHLVVADIAIEDQESHHYTNTGIANGLMTGKCRSLRSNPHWYMTVENFEWNVTKKRRPCLRHAVSRYPPAYPRTSDIYEQRPKSLSFVLLNAKLTRVAVVLLNGPSRSMQREWLVF